MLYLCDKIHRAPITLKTLSSSTARVPPLTLPEAERSDIGVKVSRVSLEASGQVAARVDPTWRTWIPDRQEEGRQDEKTFMRPTWN